MRLDCTVMDTDPEATLTRKKNVRAGHRASTTRLLGRVDPALAVTPPDLDRLSQLKQSLEDKLGTLAISRAPSRRQNRERDYSS